MRAEPCKGWPVRDSTGCRLVYIKKLLRLGGGGQLSLGSSLRLLYVREFFVVVANLFLLFPLTLSHISKASTLDLFKQSRNCSYISCTTILASDIYKSLFLDMKS